MSHPTADRSNRLPPGPPLTRGDLLRRCGSGGQRVAGVGTQPAWARRAGDHVLDGRAALRDLRAPASASRDYVVLFGRHYNREGAVLRGRGTLQECRRITERALSCKVRDTESFEEIVAEPGMPRMATGWDIVWCDGRKMGADATDDDPGSSATSLRGCAVRRLARPASRGRRPRRRR